MTVEAARSVAPLTGAWIETTKKLKNKKLFSCRAPHGRVD